MKKDASCLDWNIRTLLVLALALQKLCLLLVIPLCFVGLTWESQGELTEWPRQEWRICGFLEDCGDLRTLSQSRQAMHRQGNA